VSPNDVVKDECLFVIPRSAPTVEAARIRLELYLTETANPHIAIRHGHFDATHLAFHLDYLLATLLARNVHGRLDDDGTGPTPLVPIEDIKLRYAYTPKKWIQRIAASFVRRAEKSLVKKHCPELLPFFDGDT
jgi:hypothetical protein